MGNIKIDKDSKIIIASFISDYSHNECKNIWHKGLYQTKIKVFTRYSLIHLMLVK